MVSKCGSTPGSVKSVSEKQAKVPAQRQAWANYSEFITSCIGYVCGVGVVWRFPYIALLNGGLAFVIPYFIFILLCGIPLSLMELTLGQYTGLSPYKLFRRLSPMFHGIAYSMILMSWYQCIPYNVIFSWCLFFIYESFREVLPWTTCGNSWNTDNCTEVLLYGVDRLNITAEVRNTTVVTWGNGATSAEEEYWHNRVLNVSGGLDDIGEIQGHLLLMMTIAWMGIYLCVFKGIQWSGKVALVSCTLPYFLLMALFINGLTLEGSAAGLQQYLSPDWSKLFSFDTWTIACFQVFYSLGPGWGGIHAMASYNEFSHNLYIDAFVFPLASAVTYFIGSLAIFANLGYLAHQANTTIDKVVETGPGLAFMVYPAVFRTLPLPQFWAVIFFITLLALGVDGQFGMMDTLLASVEDAFPRLRPYKPAVAAVACIVGYLIGICYITNGGIFVFQLTDYYAAAIAPTLVCLVEVVVFAWIYGVDRVYDDLTHMTGKRPSIVWKLIWKYFSPTLILFMMVMSVTNFRIPPYRGFVYSDAWHAFGLFSAWVYVLPIVMPAVVCVYRNYSPQLGLWQTIKQQAVHTSSWGPRPEALFSAVQQGEEDDAKTSHLLYIDSSSS